MEGRHEKNHRSAGGGIKVSDRGRHSGREFSFVCEQGVRVMAECCPTCIFRAANRALLPPGLLREMVEGVREISGVIPCHETLDQEVQAGCRGQFDSGRAVGLQVAAGLGFVAWHCIAPQRPT
jgi:hypothetical protein